MPEDRRMEYRGWQLLVQRDWSGEGWFGVATDGENPGHIAGTPGYIRSDGYSFGTRMETFQWLERQVDLVVAADAKEASDDGVVD